MPTKEEIISHNDQLIEHNFRADPESAWAFARIFQRSENRDPIVGMDSNDDKYLRERVSKIMLKIVADVYANPDHLNEEFSNVADYVTALRSSYKSMYDQESYEFKSLSREAQTQAILEAQNLFDENVAKIKNKFADKEKARAHDSGLGDEDKLNFAPSLSSAPSASDPLISSSKDSSSPPRTR